MLAADYVEEITWSFRKQRLRTALTSIGIAIGAFAITIMVGLGQGVESYIANQVLLFGNPRIVVVFPEQLEAAAKIMERITRFGRPAQKIDEEDSLERRERRGGIWITPEQVENMKRIPGVAQVAPMTWLELDGIGLIDTSPGSIDTLSLDLAALNAVSKSADADPPGEAASGPAAPTPSAYYETDFAALATHPLVGKPSAGRLPRDDSPGEVVISPHYAESFRLDAKGLLGRLVALRVPKLASVQQRFFFRDPTKWKDEHRLFYARVVGLAERSPFSRGTYTSLALGREMARYESGNPEILSDQKIGVQAHVRIAEDADPRAVKAAIRKLGLAAKSVEEQLKELTRSFLIVKLALSAFGLIAVLVATLGIANTLLMAISERTREIGVMKALGATEGTIRRMFAAEAAAIGLAGGVLGSAAAIALGAVLNLAARRFLDTEAFQGFSAFAFPIWLVLGAIAFSSAIGALAGLYPANRAARLDPIEALRYE